MVSSGYSQTPVSLGLQTCAFQAFVGLHRAPKRQKRSQHTLEANLKAQNILANLHPASRPTDDDVLQVLDMMDLEKTKRRKNVTRPEQVQAGGIISVSLALVRNKITKGLQVSTKTAEMRDVCMLLGRWACIDGVDAVPFTSMTLNKDYNAGRHRDENNSGPSLVRGLGNFQGGDLLYWPNDPHGSIASLKESDACVCDVRNCFVPILGRCAHEVTPFTGTRYSIVFYCVEGWKGAEDSVRQILELSGFRWPTPYSNLQMQARVDYAYAKGSAGSQIAGCTEA